MTAALKKKARAVHYRNHARSWNSCGQNAERSVSVTKNWAEVTCKNCLQYKPETTQVDVFDHEVIASVLGEDYGYK